MARKWLRTHGLEQLTLREHLCATMLVRLKWFTLIVFGQMESHKKEMFALATHLLLRHLVFSSGPTRGGAAGAPPRGPQESRGPMSLKVQNEMGKLCTKFLMLYFYVYSLVQIN